MIAFTKNRTILYIGGTIAILIGGAALVWPSITARIFAFLVGAFFLTEAVVDFISSGKRRLYTWSAIVQGVVGIAIALLLVLMPGTALQLVVVMIAVWLIIRGLLHLWIAFQNRETTGFPLFAGSTGATSTVVGLLLLFRPEAGVIAFSWLIGIYAILVGVFSLLWARRVGDVAKRAEEGTWRDVT